MVVGEGLVPLIVGLNHTENIHGLNPTEALSWVLI